MITIRKPNEIYEINGQIQNGTFHGRWHFSFDQYRDPDYMRFGTLCGSSTTTHSLLALYGRCTRTGRSKLSPTAPAESSAMQMKTVKAGC